jgi:hypothetical protein
MKSLGLSSAAALALLASFLSTTAEAQWLKYPTPGTPRLPDGTPNMAAPAPRTADGKPDQTSAKTRSMREQILNYGRSA